ncbi:MAG: SRPBCC family protein [Albidovulum sp.]
MPYRHSLKRSAVLPGSPDSIFTALDDPARLGRHMTKPSAMMLGGTMGYDLGPERGRGLGARIDLRGSVLGIRLSADQRVIEYDPPRRKVWETAPEVQLLAIGAYRLGFAITPEGPGSRLDVFIDYDLPKGWFGRILGLLLGGLYARWCVESILRDAATARA